MRCDVVMTMVNSIAATEQTQKVLTINIVMQNPRT
jgi:hypothetical protein